MRVMAAGLALRRIGWQASHQMADNTVGSPKVHRTYTPPLHVAALWDSWCHLQRRALRPQTKNQRAGRPRPSLRTPQALFDFAPYLYLALFTFGGLPAARADLRSFYAIEAGRRLVTDLLVPLATPWARRRLSATRPRPAGQQAGQQAVPPPAAAPAGSSFRQQQLDRSCGKSGSGSGAGSSGGVGAASASIIAGASGAAAGEMRQRRAAQIDASAGGADERAAAALAAPSRQPHTQAGWRRLSLQQAARDALKPPLPGDGSCFEDTSAIVRDASFALVFASAFPSGPLICAALTALRLRLLRARLLGGCRRPLPRRAAGIGRSWRALIACQVILDGRASNSLVNLSSRGSLHQLLSHVGMRRFAQHEQ
jgi:hypothetical protein